MSVIQIYANKGGRYVLDVNAFRRCLASSKDNQVAIYSVAGPLRTGKSFLLSFFIQYLRNRTNPNWIKEPFENSYEYASGPTRKTTGIWMWSEPFIIKQANDKNVSLFLLDTQGCFDSKTSNQENAVVFALSALLSSFMIFNIQKQIDESILQFLQFYASYSRLADNDNKDEPFQKLMFLIRDWEWPDDYNYGYYDDQTSINGKNFKKDFLDTNSEQVAEVRVVHESIADTFENISCYLMPHPGKQVSQKADFNLNTVDEDFLDHLKIIVPMVLRDGAVVTNKLGGQLLTGGQLVMFVEKWSKQFKAERLPKSTTLHQATVEQQNEMAKSFAIDNYCMKIKKCLSGSSDAEFQAKHRQLVNESVNLFKNHTRLEKEFDPDYLDKLNASLETFYNFNFQLNKSARDHKEYKILCDKLAKNNEEYNKKMQSLEKSNKEDKARYEQLIRDNEKKQEEVNEKLRENERKAEEIKEKYIEQKRKNRSPTLTEAAEDVVEAVNVFGKSVIKSVASWFK